MFFFGVFFFGIFRMIGHHFIVPVDGNRLNVPNYFWMLELIMKQRMRYETNNKTKKNKRNEIRTKKRQKLAKCENFCVKTNITFFAPKNKCKKIHTLFFFFDHWMLFECLRCCFVGWKAVLAQKYPHKWQKQQKCVVCLVSKQKRMVFHRMTKCKRKLIHCVAFSLILWWWCLSFFLFCWLGEKLSWSRAIFSHVSKIQAKQKRKNMPIFKDTVGKEQVLAHCEKQQFLLWHKQKERKMYFLNSIVVVGNKKNMVCVCVLSNVMTVSTKHKYFSSRFKSWL